MTLTIVSNSFGLARCEKRNVEIFQNNLNFQFSCEITTHHIIFTARVLQLGEAFRLFFGTDFLTPHIIFDFIHHPFQFEFEIKDKIIRVCPVSPFSSLENPKSIVKSRVERELASINSSHTREKIRHFMVKTFFSNEKPLSETDELEIIPFIPILKKPTVELLLRKLKRYDACAFFIKMLIYEKKIDLYEEMILNHFQKYASIEDPDKLEYTIACIECFILKGKTIPNIEKNVKKDPDLDYLYAYKYFEFILTAENALEVVKTKYDCLKDISSYPVWLQSHFLKEHLAAPKRLEMEKECRLFHLLTIYVDLAMPLNQNINKLQKLIRLRSVLPYKKRFVSEEGENLSRWILNTLQNLHKNEFWNASLRQKVVEISHALNLRWQFPDTFREAYHPFLYYDAKKKALPFYPIVDEMKYKILFHPQLDDFHFPINAIHNNHIVTIKDVLERFIESSCRVLIVEGDRGSGKTASLINFCDQLLVRYSENHDFIPYYHHDKGQCHPTITDPLYKELSLQIPFLFIFDDVNSQEDIPYFDVWKREFPKAKFIFAARKMYPIKERHEKCSLIPLGTDQALSFLEKMSKQKPLRYKTFVYLKALNEINPLNPFHIVLTTRLVSRKIHPDNPDFSKKLGDAIHTLESIWDQTKQGRFKENPLPPSLHPIIKWFRKLNRSVSEG